MGQWGKAVTSLIFLAGLILGPITANAQFSGFATGVEGWSIVSFTNLSTDNYSIAGTYAATFTATGGNPGGYLFSTDPDSNNFMFSAPALFLGNQGNAVGSGLSYDLRSTASLNYSTTDVMLVSGSTRLLWESSPTLVPSATWTTVVVPFAPSGQWHVGTTTGALATSLDFSNVLGNLTGLYIRGEYAFPGSDATGLDNVRLGLVPEPGTLTLLLIGLCSTAAFLRTRPRRERAEIA